MGEKGRTPLTFNASVVNAFLITLPLVQHEKFLLKSTHKLRMFQEVRAEPSFSAVLHLSYFHLLTELDRRHALASRPNVKFVLNSFAYVCVSRT